jgi:ubiquitin carboxyl-terminal hydrolase 10
MRRTRRKRKPAAELSAAPVELPIISQETDAEEEVEEQYIPAEQIPAGEPAAEPIIPRPETPTSHPVSEETVSTNPTTPSSIPQQSIPAAGETTPVPPKPSRPAVPVVPALPKAIPRDIKPAPAKTPESPQTEKLAADARQDPTESNEASTEQTEEVKEASPPPKAWTTPKLWTGLFNPVAAISTAASSESGRAAAAPTIGKTNAESLTEALKSFNAVSNESRVAFLEPRGLVNTGNMCYMNSVSPLSSLNHITGTDKLQGFASPHLLCSIL